MKKETLNRMLEQVDDDLLQESLATEEKKARYRWSGTAVAAALAVVLGAGIGLGAWLHGLPMDGDRTESATAIAEGTTETIAEGADDGAMTGHYWTEEDTETLVGDYEVGASCMKTPEVGEAIIFPGLQQAMKDHEGLEVLYVVNMDVFFAEERVEYGALQQEADALTAEGYTVVEVKQPESWIVLHMTAEEIQNFTAVRCGYGLRSGPLPMFSVVTPEMSGSATSEAPDNDLAVETTDDDWVKVIYGDGLPECNCTETAVQPRNGEVVIRHDLQHGMDLHEGEEVYFFVAAELYKDGKHLTGEEALEPLIVSAKKSLWWNLRGLGGPEEISFLAEVTAEQIESFAAPEGYAVLLRFAEGHEENDGVVASFWWE